MDFEWDAAKARTNQVKHGVSFDEAKSAFGDPFGLEDVQVVDGEERFRLLARAST